MKENLHPSCFVSKNNLRAEYFYTLTLSFGKNKYLNFGTFISFLYVPTGGLGLFV